MKKRLVTALALMFGLGIGATAFAAANPFVDVPAKHWAYDAVNKLAKAGIVDGYGDGTFRGDRTMTRYEMAQIVAKAMARSDKADAETKATIDKLATEFSAEIENLGVRVAKLEKKSDNVKFSGNLRARYINHDFDNNIKSDNLNDYRMRLAATAEVNDTWTVNTMFESTVNSFAGSDNGSGVVTKTANATGKLGVVDMTLGRWLQTSSGDMVFDENSITGVKFGFGNQLKAQVYYGTSEKSAGLGVYTTDPTRYPNATVLGTDLNWAASKNLSVFGSWNQMKNRDDLNDKKHNFWEAGAAYTFSKDWKLTGVYGKSNEDEQNKLFKAEVQYKAVDLNKAGTWQVALGYTKMEQYSTWDTGLIISPQDAFNKSAGTMQGAKGWYFDGSYVPAKNIKVRTMYGDFKSTVGADVKDKLYRLQAEFFF